MGLRFYSQRIAFLCLGFLLVIFGRAGAADVTYTVSITKTDNTGTGTVKSTAAGINCGSTCSSAFDAFSLVTLTAVPDSNSYFNGWSGDCSSKALTCTLKIDGAKSVHADFTATPPAITPWVKKITTSGYDAGAVVRQTSDGGYVIAGQLNGSGIGNGSFAVVKLKADGTADWQKVYYGTGATTIEQTAEGGYIVGGSIWVGIPGTMSYIPVILKLKSDGTIDWQKQVGGGYYSSVSTIRQSNDGNYIAGGTYQPLYNGTSYFWLAQIASDGSAYNWHYTYGSGGSASKLSPTSDGGFIVSGNNSGGGWVAKVSTTGNIAWQNNYSEGVGEISQTSDGGYIATTGQGGVMKLDSEGAVTWSKTFTATLYPQINSVQETFDGKFIAVGGREMSGGTFWNWDIWVLKLGTLGNVIWQKTYTNNKNEVANSVRQIADGGYIVTAGSTSSYSASTDAMWVLKLDANGNVLGCSGSYVTNQSETASDYSITPSATFLEPANTLLGLNDNAGSPTDAAATISAFCSGTSPLLVLSPDSMDFGLTAIGTSTYPLLISNEGNADLTLTSLWIDPTTHFSYDVLSGGKPCGSETATIVAGDSCTVAVSFSPVALGWQSTTLQVASNDPMSPANTYPRGTGATSLTIIPSGTGVGTVTSANGINCAWNGSTNSGNCEILSSIINTFDLTATAGECSFFKQWNTLCNDSDPTCNLTMSVANGNQTAGAEFGLYPLAWSGSYQTGGYPTISDTYTNAASGTLYVQGRTFSEDLIFSRAIDITFDTGWNCDYSLRNGYTTVRSLTVSNGSVTFNNGSFVISKTVFL